MLKKDKKIMVYLLLNNAIQEGVIIPLVGRIKFSLITVQILFSLHNSLHKSPRSHSLRESKSNSHQVNFRISLKNRNPSVECEDPYNIESQYQYQTPEAGKNARTDYLKIYETGRNLAIPTISIPCDILCSEEAAPLASKLSKKELLKAATSIKQNTDSKTRLNREIDDLIRQQKESLKKDFLKAKESEECFKVASNIKSSPGEGEEAVERNFEQFVKPM